MNTLTNNTFIAALKREPHSHPPIWIMRQAGRYLPEYRELRAKAHNFMAFCKNPQWATAATLQPFARYPLDAAIVFSDILTIPEAMGMDLEFIEHQGPVFHNPLKNIRDITALAIPDPNESLQYVMDTIKLCQKELAGKVPLIGFSGSPWTLACYMLEGSTSKNFSAAKKLLYQDPAASHLLLQKLQQAVSLYCAAQIHAGVDVIMLFDTWGGILSTEQYQEYSLSYMQQILADLASYSIPSIIFTKGGGQWLEMIAASGCHAVGLDWTIELSDAKNRIGGQVSLQGNLDPYALFAPPEVVAEQAKKLLNSYGKGYGHIFNLGHGIDPQTPPEHVAALIETVHHHRCVG